ncbi:MAG: ChbG/HpnK family deacetylase [Chloroflexota bacterium]|jgi:hypothetical protein
MENEPNSRVIINGDDFGMSPGVNQAIIKLHRQGRMNSTSIMTNMPWSEEALHYAQSAATLQVGIHLNLSTGEPILPPDRVPSLVTPEGEFHDMSAFLSRLLAGRIQRSELILELEAQFETFLDHSIQPVHIDSHMHFHAVPTLNEIVSELASRYGVGQVRNPNISAFIVPPPGRAGLVEHAIRKTGASVLNSTQTMMTRKGILLNGPSNRAENLIYLRWFLEQNGEEKQIFITGIDGLNEGTVEIIAHPSLTDEVLPTLSNYVQGRQEELAFLESDTFYKLLVDIP